VVNFSSINALGQAEPNHPGLYLPLDDDTPHFNVQNYSLTKHIGEEMCRAFASRGVFSAVSLRPSFVIQPQQERRWWDMLPEDFKLRGYINDFFSFVDVRDVVEAVVLGLDASIEIHQAFLLTSTLNRTDLPTAEIISRHYSHLPWLKIPKEEYLSRDEFISLVDCTAAKRVLGWEPTYKRIHQDDPESK
jgi:nucleoside-diphosphate-sugar epimerase